VTATRRGRRAAARLSLTLALCAAGCSRSVDVAVFRELRPLRRELAVAQRGPTHDDVAPDPRCEAVARRQGGVFLSYGQRVVFYADLPEDAALRVASLVRCGGAGRTPGRLEATATTDDGATTRVELVAATDARAVSLAPARGPARIELVARAGGKAGGSGGLLVRELALATRSTESASPGATLVARSATPKPSILIWLIDALRRDGLGCYGGRDGVSPHLDRLAAESVVFDDAVAQGSWTRPAVASLLTGVTPLTHGVLTTKEALGEEAVTLAERLHDGGYRTLGLVANINVGGKMGFRQGFDRLQQLLGPREGADELAGELLGWLDGAPESDRTHPFFAYLHTIEPHGPYKPPEAFRTRFAPDVPPELGLRRQLRGLESGETPQSPSTATQLRALYDAEIAANDDAFGRLRGELERRGLWNDLVVVVLADHGEEFHEHGGWEHGAKLRDETLAIPLLVKIPGLGARRVAALAQQVDLVPTLAELAGLPSPVDIDGASLLPAARGRAPAFPAPAISYQRTDDGDEAVVTTSAYRLSVWKRTDGTRLVSLFDRRRDPHEQRNVVRELPIVAAYLESVLVWPSGGRGALARPAGALDAEGEAQLRALGYAH
jgi:arylsulfatase A-like enzyme